MRKEAGSPEPRKSLFDRSRVSSSSQEVSGESRPVTLLFARLSRTSELMSATSAGSTPISPNCRKRSCRTRPSEEQLTRSHRSRHGSELGLSTSQGRPFTKSLENAHSLPPSERCISFSAAR
eukprot:Amastigsp_a6216_11.p4 type:complete len:122 gc:universal Amastigsp_a6216_11:1472-1837(+)